MSWKENVDLCSLKKSRNFCKTDQNVDYFSILLKSKALGWSIDCQTINQLVWQKPARPSCLKYTPRSSIPNGLKTESQNGRDG